MGSFAFGSSRIVYEHDSPRSVKIYNLNTKKRGLYRHTNQSMLLWPFQAIHSNTGERMECVTLVGKSGFLDVIKTPETKNRKMSFPPCVIQNKPSCGI